MVTLMRGIDTQENWTRHESVYQTEYATWGSFLNDIPVLRQILEMRAASVLNSWQVKGTHAKQAQKFLEGMTGRGKETFREIMINLYKVAWICGDAYAEKIYDGDEIVDLEILPADNIRQIIKEGKIIRYEEIDGEAKWEPHKIFHIRYKPRGCMTHGIGMIEPMNNLLVTYKQMLQSLSETYERQGKERIILFSRSDSDAKIKSVRDAIKEGGKTWDGVIVMPINSIDPNTQMSIKFSPTLAPQDGLKAINEEIFKATSTSELLLGVGYSTSEEDARLRLGGYHQSIRSDQEDREDEIETQLFAEMWPTNTPTIELSYSDESFDLKFNRNMQFMQSVDASPTIAPENKNELIKETLLEMKKIT